MDSGMTEKEMLNNLIDNYANLQRIKNADDINREIEYQLTILRIKLKSFGIVANDLNIN